MKERTNRIGVDTFCGRMPQCGLCFAPDCLNFFAKMCELKSKGSVAPDLHLIFRQF
jgi:hypothetical protein